jgi:protein TonB
MMEGAFYQQKRTSPTALTIVVLMHGAGITALALAKTDVMEKIWHPPIVVTPIPEDKPPPPEPKPIEKSVIPPPASVVTHVPPVIKTPPRDVLVEYKPLPPVQQPVFEKPVEIVPPRMDPPARPEPEAKTVEPARARANLASYVSDEDYPTTAVRNEEQGTTRFRLAVGTGRAG